MTEQRSSAIEGIQAQPDELLLIRLGIIHLSKRAVISLLSKLQEQRRSIAQTLRESGLGMIVRRCSVSRRKPLLAQRDEIVDFVTVEFEHLQHQRARQLRITAGDRPGKLLVQIARRLAAGALRSNLPDRGEVGAQQN